MIRISEKSLFLVALTLITGAILIDAGQLRDDVSLVPRVIGYPLFVLCLLGALAELFPELGNRLKRQLPQRVQLMFRSTAAPVSSDAVEQEIDDPDVPTRYVFLAWISGAIMLTYLIGIFWASGIAMFIWVKFFAGKGWGLSLALTAGTFAFVYGLFVVGFSYEYFMRPILPWWRI